MRIKIDGRLELLHRVLASVHIGRRLLREECVNHKDGNKLNNNLDNLEIVSAKENFAHAVANELYCSGSAWYAARGLQEPSTTRTTVRRIKRSEAPRT